MNQSISLYQLVSPQQLLQLRQPNTGSAAPAAWQVPPNPGAPQPPQTAPQSRFGQVSALLSPDQLQMYRPSQPSQAQNRILANPISLFAASPTPSAPTSAAPKLSAPNQLQPAPVQAAAPAVDLNALRHKSSVERLKTMAPSELKELGASDKKAFFAALLPAAMESERNYGVPAALTLAQAALESGWGRSPIGGYNIFGIKGTGPAGKTSVDTKEFLNGKWVNIKDGFAKYNNFYEAVQRHGKLFHNGYYNKAVNQYSRDQSLYGFINNIQGIYATDPNYSKKIKSIIEDHGLQEMVARGHMV